MSALSLIQQGGITLIPLAICSVLIVAVVLERIWAYSRSRKLSHDLLRRVESALDGNDWQGAYRLLSEEHSPYARIAQASLLHRPLTPRETDDMLTLACDVEVAAANRALPILGTIGNIAPFIGLFGTVIGIMRAFAEVAARGTDGASHLSSGIWEALIATAIGLGIGIVAVVANNWCHAWVERYRLNLEQFATEWSYRLQHKLHAATAQKVETVA